MLIEIWDYWYYWYKSVLIFNNYWIKTRLQKLEFDFIFLNYQLIITYFSYKWYALFINFAISLILQWHFIYWFLVPLLIFLSWRAEFNFGPSIFRDLRFDCYVYCFLLSFYYIFGNFEFDLSVLLLDVLTMIFIGWFLQ